MAACRKPRVKWVAKWQTWLAPNRFFRQGHTDEELQAGWEFMRRLRRLNRR